LQMFMNAVRLNAKQNVTITMKNSNAILFNIDVHQELTERNKNTTTYNTYYLVGSIV